MKNYCIVSFCNMYNLPYAKLYVDKIIESGNKCSLLYWDRDDDSGDKDKINELCELIPFHRVIKPNCSKLDLLLGYIGASSFFNYILGKRKFDGVIFLQTHAAVACAIQSFLKYSGKYIIDIRDYSLENHAVYRYIEEHLINKSYSTVISSPAYSCFLPKFDYVVAHNYVPFPKDIIKKIRDSWKINRNSVINISFVGTVRFFSIDRKILQIFANDERFKINYYGKGSEVLKEFCENKGIYNVEFYGSFNPLMTTNFYVNTSLINNIYGNKNKFLDYALSNKLYHSAQLRIPILVSPKTYMEEVVSEYNMGYSIDLDDPDIANKLYRYYSELDIIDLHNGCDEFLSKVCSDNEAYEKMIENFIG